MAKLQIMIADLNNACDQLVQIKFPQKFEKALVAGPLSLLTNPHIYKRLIKVKTLRLTGTIKGINRVM